MNSSILVEASWEPPPGHDGTLGWDFSETFVVRPFRKGSDYILRDGGINEGQVDGVRVVLSLHRFGVESSGATHSTTTGVSEPERWTYSGDGCRHSIVAPGSANTKAKANSPKPADDRIGGGQILGSLQ